MVAMAVELSPPACVTPIVPVGKVGVPVKVGEAIVDFKSNAVCVAVEIGWSKSDVFCIFSKTSWPFLFTTCA